MVSENETVVTNKFAFNLKGGLQRAFLPLYD